MAKAQAWRPDGQPAERARFRVSLLFLLASAFGTLVAVAVGSVLTMSVLANFANTFSLLNERAIATLNGMETAIRTETGRAEGVVETAAMLASEGAMGSDASPDTAIALRSLLLSERLVEGLFLLREGSDPVGFMRTADGRVVAAPARDLAQAFGPQWLEDARRLPGTAGWTPPARIGERHYHIVARPYAIDGQVAGVAVAAVGRATINRVIASLGQFNAATAFVLNERGEVIAHSSLQLPFQARDAIPIAEFPDEALRKYPQAKPSDEFGAANAQGITVLDTDAPKSGYAYMVKQLGGYGAPPYTLGAYVAMADTTQEIRRALASLMAGLGGLVASVIAAILIGRRISRPMNNIAAAAENLAAFELESIAPLPRSRILEIDHQAVALNRTRVAMSEFARYVPRPLVARLLRDGVNGMPTEEREVTIMFTDIVGFTGLSERMDATETAEFLNAHFHMLGSIIEARGGTVDKFMGDGVMAFWGAPEDDSRHACNAVEAANSIASALHAANLLRRRAGKEPVRLRIGLHTGKAVVGNIGGGARQNYTMVGDAVNVAQRLEQMGKQAMRVADECVVLASEDVVKAVAGEARFIPAGTQIVRGREKPVATWMLDIAADRNAKVVEFPGAQSA